jgi:hypothetical protein
MPTDWAPEAALVTVVVLVEMVVEVKVVLEALPPWVVNRYPVDAPNTTVSTMNAVAIVLKFNALDSDEGCLLNELSSKSRPNYSRDWHSQTHGVSRLRGSPVAEYAASRASRQNRGGHHLERLRIDKSTK